MQLTKNNPGWIVFNPTQGLKRDKLFAVFFVCLLDSGNKKAQGEKNKVGKMKLLYPQKFELLQKVTQQMYDIIYRPRIVMEK